MLIDTTTHISQSFQANTDAMLENTPNKATQQSSDQKPDVTIGENTLKNSKFSTRNVDVFYV